MPLSSKRATLSAAYVAAGVGAGVAAAADGSDEGAGDASIRGAGMRCSRGWAAAGLREVDAPEAAAAGLAGVCAAVPRASKAAALTGTSFIDRC